MLYAIDNESKLSRIKIGKRGMPQAIIQAGMSFAAALESRKSYCLLGCTVSPGLDYRDWELGKRDELASMYPKHKKLIERYTK